MTSTLAGSYAKVTPPTILECCRRTRLFKKLDNRKNAQIFWVSGPAGSGKTTLVKTYVDRLGHPCLWFQLDPGDNEPASFFHYLGLAARKAVPTMRKPLPTLTPGYLPGLPLFSLRFFEMLYNRLKLPCTAVFDNYQVLAEASPIHLLLGQGLEHLPEGLTVFLVSRTQPPPVLARLRAHDQMALLQWEDLRLTAEETREIAALRLNTGLDPVMVRDLHTKADGWAAGLALMLESILSAKGGPPAAAPGSGSGVFDYLAGEVFDNSAEALKTFLFSTALLPEFSLKMAQALTGNRHAQAHLGSLSRKNYFINRIKLRQSYYRYHPLFRQFLIAKAREMLPESDLTDLYSRSARILEADGKPDAAVELWLDVEHWNEVSRIILMHGPEFLEQGRFQLVHTWLQQLPEKRLENDPRLLVQKSLCSMFSSPLDAKETAEKAYRGFTKKGDIPGRMFAWTVVVEAIEFAQGNFGPLEKWIEEFDGFKTEYSSLEDPSIKARFACSMIVALSFGQPRHPDLPRWIERALHAPGVPDSAGQQVKACFQAVWHHTSFTGDLISARFYLDRMMAFTQKPSVDPMAKIMACLMACNFYEFAGETDACLEIGTRGLELSKKTGFTIWDSPIQGAMAQACINSGNLEKADTYLKLVEEHMDMTTHFGQVMSHFVRTRYLLITGEIRRAEIMIDQMPAMYARLNMWFCYPMPELQRAQAEGLKGDYQKALSLIGQALEKNSRSHSRHHETVFLFEKAHFELALGKKKPGLSSLAKALGAARELGLMFCFFDLPAITMNLCTRAIQEGIEVD